jgi:hypothetical protein
MANAQEKLSILQEVAKRGLQDSLKPEQRAVFDEAHRRGLIDLGGVELDFPALQGSELEAQRAEQEEREAAIRAAQPGASFGEKALGTGETALTAVTGLTGGLFGQALGSVEGIIKEAVAGEFGTSDAADRIEKLAMERAQQLTFMPRTEEGQKQTKAFGEAVAPLAAVPPLAELQAVGSVVGRLKLPSKLNKQLVDPETNLPTPQFSKALKRREIEFGTLLDEQGGLPLFSGARTPDQFVDDIIRQRISSGDQSGSLYRFRIANGRVIDDALGEEALKQGFRKGDIASAKGANPQTRARMRQMLNMKRQISADESRALNFRPTDVVGDSVMSRFQFLTDEARRLRLELDDIAGKSRTVSGRNLLESDASRPALAGRMIDTSRVANRFSQGLDDLQIGFSIENRKPKFNFENSLISEDKTSQRVIRSVANILAKGGDVDAQAAHLVKRQLDSMLDFNRSSASGLTDAGEKFAKNIRASVNESIRDVSPAYARINDDLSQILGTIDDFSGSLGRVDPFAENASAAVGQTMRRLLSNVQSRADLDTALINLDDAAARLGGEFPVDIKRLILFNKTLDDRFGATARGSFQGDIESALRSGPTAAAKDFVTKKAAEKIQDVRGISDENAFNTMQQILNRDQ